MLFNPKTDDQRISKILSHLAPSHTVIDVGCAHHHAERRADPYWLHQHVVDVSPNTIGIELEEDECAKLITAGYKVICANVESSDLPQKTGTNIDVIVAGELIEHLSNPGLFLDNAYKILRSKGKLILTTPNPWNFFNMLSIVVRNRVPIHNQHTAWYDETTLTQLVTRHGFKVEELSYLHWMKGQKGELVSKLLYKLGLKRLSGAGILLVLTKNCDK